MLKMSMASSCWGRSLRASASSLPHLATMIGSAELLMLEKSASLALAASTASLNFLQSRKTVLYGWSIGQILHPDHSYNGAHSVGSFSSSLSHSYDHPGILDGGRLTGF